MLGTGSPGRPPRLSHSSWALRFVISSEGPAQSLAYYGHSSIWWPRSIVLNFGFESECSCSALLDLLRHVDCGTHTPSIAFRHLPPNSARFSYATEGALFRLRAAVHRRGQRPLKGSGTEYDCRSNLAPKHARKHETHPPRVKRKKKKEEDFRLDSNDCGFICTGVIFVGGCKWHALFYLSFL